MACYCIPFYFNFTMFSTLIYTLDVKLFLQRKSLTNQQNVSIYLEYSYQVISHIVIKVTLISSFPTQSHSLFSILQYTNSLTEHQCFSHFCLFLLFSNIETPTATWDIYSFLNTPGMFSRLTLFLSLTKHGCHLHPLSFPDYYVLNFLKKTPCSWFFSIPTHIISCNDSV